MRSADGSLSPSARRSENSGESTPQKRFPPGLPGTPTPVVRAHGGSGTALYHRAFYETRPGKTSPGPESQHPAHGSRRGPRTGNQASGVATQSPEGGVPGRAIRPSFSSNPRIPHPSHVSPPDFAGTGYLTMHSALLDSVCRFIQAAYFAQNTDPNLRGSSLPDNPLLAFTHWRLIAGRRPLPRGADAEDRSWRNRPGSVRL
jgi:hypothetical protein